MKIVILYTDGETRDAGSHDVPTRSPLARQPLGDDKAPSVPTNRSKP